MRLAKIVLPPITLALAALTPAAAEEIVREPDLIAAMPIQGVTLATPPEEAFNHFMSLGYDAGDIETYADWEGTGLNLVRGATSDPDGESWITLQRANGHLVNIAETFSRPRDPFDTRSEIGAAQNHFGVAADDPKCRVNDAGTGTCRVADAQENANFVYGMTAFPVQLQRYATRNRELGDAW